jgi:Zn-dependent protease with chaperone function
MGRDAARPRFCAPVAVTGGLTYSKNVGAVASRKTWILRTCLEFPGFVLSGALLVILALVIGFWPWGVLVIGVWAASGPLILIRRVEDAIMKGREGLRRPTLAERRLLAPAWLAVARAAGVNPSDYSVWVQKSRKINAFAAAGHTVTVTEAAIENLSAGQLEAVLGHELGHLFGRHAGTSLLRYWYSLPAAYVFGFATSFSMALMSALASGSIAISVAIVAVVVLFLGYLVAAIPIVGIVAAVLVVLPFGLLWIRRAQEYEADAVAARIGYGEDLARLLRTTLMGGKARSGWRYRLVETHPSNVNRAGRLESLLNKTVG